MRLVCVVTLLALAGCKGTVTVDFGRPLWTVQGQFAAAAIGDVNGDGFRDICLGSDGQLQCFLNGAGGISAAPSWQSVPAYSLPPIWRAGIAIGDINGDGYGDLASSGGWGSSSSTWHAPELYLGGPMGLPAAPSAKFPLFGAEALSVAFEDIDCDGVDDLVIGENYGTAVDYGHSSAEGFRWRGHRPESAGRAVSPGRGDMWPVTTVGDVNADGCGDIMLGEMHFVDGPIQPDVSLYPGGPRGIAATPTWDGKDSIDESIWAVGLGSLGDGRFGHVLIAAMNHVAGKPTPQLLVFAGEPTGLGDQPAWTVDASAVLTGDWPVLPRVGDVNGDGIADIFLPDGLYLGRRGVPPGPFDGATPVWSLAGNTPAAVGDVDRDGCDDFVVLTDDGATLYSGGAIAPD